MNRIENIKFNLTKEMAMNIITINGLKNELYDLQVKMKFVNDEEYYKLRKQYDEIKKEIELYKSQFINQFKLNNKKEILEYLKLQKESK